MVRYFGEGAIFEMSDSGCLGRVEAIDEGCVSSDLSHQATCMQGVIGVKSEGITCCSNVAGEGGVTVEVCGLSSTF